MKPKKLNELEQLKNHVVELQYSCDTTKTEIRKLSESVKDEREAVTRKKKGRNTTLLCLSGWMVAGIMFLSWCVDNKLNPQKEWHFGDFYADFSPSAILMEQRGDILTVHCYDTKLKRDVISASYPKEVVQ